MAHELKLDGKKYCTDRITNVLCNVYNENISDSRAVRMLSDIEEESPGELAQYLLDTLNRGVTWKGISVIPETK